VEGQPNAVVEAAVAHCPLVLSDIPAHRAFLDSSSATFAPPSDAAAISRAIEAVLDDPPAAREKARHARTAVEGWSIDHIAGEYIKIYDELLSRRAQAAV
jgi:glycosyltransferase involved in cell wall biosynthesis